MISLRKINITPKFQLDTTYTWNIQNSTFLPMVLMFPLVIFVSMSLADVGYSLLSYGCFAGLLAGFAFMTVIYLYGGKMSRYGFLSFVTLLSLILFSLVNISTSDLKNGTYMAFEIWMFQMLCYYFRARIHIIVISAAIYFSFCVYANIIHMMLNPMLLLTEENKTILGYLLGYNYNGMGFRFILAVTFSFLCLRYSWKWLFNAIPVIVASIIPLVLTGSKTSLTGIVIFTLVCCIPFVRVQKFAINSLMVFVILFQFFVVFSGKGLENNDFAVYIIEDVLEKDITFSYRTYLWDMSIEKISESPMWGFGNLDYDWYASHIHTQVGTGPCNLILCVLLNGGIIFLALFLTIFVMSYYQVMRYNARSANCIQAGLASIMLMHLMESLSYVFVFYLMTLAYYYPYIYNENKSSKSPQTSLLTNDSNNEIDG